jgi:hypothetical protein
MLRVLLFLAMSIQYSGGTLINRTFTPSTRADWVNNVTQALSDAGWTTISGTPGSGSDVKLETAAGNNGQKIRFRFFDPGSGNCAQVTMKNVAETFTSQIIYCLPAAGSGQWRITANKFHFFAFATGSASATAQRATAMGGTAYTFPMTNGDNVSFGWLVGSGSSDGDTNTRGGFRKSLRAAFVSTSCLFSGINGSVFLECTGSNVAGNVTISGWQGGSSSADNNYRWEDNTLPVYEALIGWATGTTNTNESKLKGQLYDACVMNGSFAGESLVSLDGRTWLVITDTPTTTVAATAVLLVAVT